MCVGSRNLANQSELGWECQNYSKNVSKVSIWSWKKKSLNQMMGFRKGVLRVANTRTTFQCECPRVDQFICWNVISSTSYFLFVQVGTNRLLMGRLAETYIDQSLYTEINGSLRFPLLSSSQLEWTSSLFIISHCVAKGLKRNVFVAPFRFQKHVHIK